MVGVVGHQLGAEMLAVDVVLKCHPDGRVGVRACQHGDELVQPRFKQPLAIRFLTAEPGPLPTGRVKRIGPLDKVLAFPGVVQADVYLQVGETIRPVRLDGDRRGYVIATADTNLEALDRAEAASRLLDVEVE